MYFFVDTSEIAWEESDRLFWESYFIYLLIDCLQHLVFPDGLPFKY